MTAALTEIICQGGKWDRIVHATGCADIPRDCRTSWGDAYEIGDDTFAIAHKYGITDPAEISALSWITDCYWNDGDVNPDDHDEVRFEVKMTAGSIYAKPCALKGGRS